MPTATSPPDTVDARVLLGVLTKLKKGDFTARMPEDWTGIAGKVADTLNEVIETNQRLGRELDRVGRTVGKQGKTSQRLNLGGFPANAPVQVLIYNAQGKGVLHLAPGVSGLVEIALKFHEPALG